MTKLKSPPKLGTVWVSVARIKIIDETVNPPRWKTLATCMNTPNAIQAELAKLKPSRPAGETYWVHDDLGDQYIVR